MKAKKYALLLTSLFISFSVFTAVVSTMQNNPFNLSTELTLSNNYNPEILSFWQQHAKSDYFQGIDDKRVHTVSIATGNNKAVVIVQGRNESVLKYKEVAYDFYRQGFDVYLIDHRGQGFSERFGGDQYRGYVENFQDYAKDLNNYITSLKLDENYQQRYLISHSMGGTISALYLQQNKTPFQASVFISPMFSINLGPLPTFLAKIITYSSAEVCSWFSNKACYVPGGKAYKKRNFESNRITSSITRFYSSQQGFQEFPETQLGAPTMRWVATSLSAMDEAIDNAHKIKTPILMIQAGADSIVTESGQSSFYENITTCQLNQFLSIEGAKHEVLLEKDEVRLSALTHTFQFLTAIEQSKQTCTK